ncbi:MAG: Fe-Mn family superoxide dismutase [Candidatus Paceibacterota bacterium]
MSFTEQKFNIPSIEGISQKTIDEHLKLYSGYVKNSNLILEMIEEYSKELDKNSYAISEIQRRFAFEFNGMRNHEYYFEQLEGGHVSQDMNSALTKQIEKDFGSTEIWFEKFKALCLTRGIGWAILYYDKKSDRLLNAWVDEQHLGQLNGLHFIYGIDMWEHSFMLDYVPGDKKKYIEAYTIATNQSVAEKRFDEAKK